ncbi:alpha-keto acid decarboxylase family protein [Bombella sp. ESL0385]|uniref:alpha-keto acid decarboxylase family protein n=1 Tax=Bombella sp. ESL0385 TaxID=2676446 RepID=UPI0012D8F363|nr:thiamine pyrophosphate-binding protein [Bombella sp. ESL0385]MUG89546.1 alpha-keto acid decarboxylase family protein [Bombella sp. ESL0385]
MRMLIGDYLIRRLAEAGISHLFGVPGDFNLSFLEQVEAAPSVSFVGSCNELNAAYAADGYARTAGLCGLVTTLGVGDLGAISGIAGAYAERVPFVHITGIPPLHAVESRALLHHTLADGGYGNIGRCMAEYTVAQARLTPANAVEEIDRVLQACWRERRPVHLQLPSDITHLSIEVPDAPLVLEDSQGDAEQVALAAEHIATRLAAARHPVMILDADVDRFGTASLVADLAERGVIACVATAPAKAVLDETAPYYLGGYVGAASRPDIRELVSQSDCVIGLGLRFTEINTGFFTQKIRPEAFINILAHEVSLAGRSIPAAPMAAVLKALLAKLFPSTRTLPARPATGAASAPGQGDDALTHAALWPRVAAFLREGDVIIGEAGTSNTALLGTAFPQKTRYIAQPIWGAIGYTLPALFGSYMGSPERRHILFIGDGSFQLTVQELSSILRHGQKPIIFLLNNKGYTIERLILGERSRYNDIANWRYAALPHAFDREDKALSLVVERVSELEDALKQAEQADKAVFIELILPEMDAPEALKRFGIAVADYDYGPTGPRNASTQTHAQKG